jgi:Xaa-Pro aminopeptidase
VVKRIVKKVDFSKEGSHVAVVATPANGQEEVTVLKSKDVDLKKAEEVQITTSMQTFLKTFFGLWTEDAAELAQILGYEPQEWYWDNIGEDTTVELMKSAVEDPKENLIHKDTYENLKKARVEFNKLRKGKIMPKEEKKEDLKKEKDLMVELEKQREEMAELKKALDAEKEERVKLEKAALKKQKDELVELCKGYSFVEDADKLADALFLCKSVEGFDLIQETLEKARKALKAALEGEKGTDEEADLTETVEIPVDVTKTAELLKARNKENK